MTLKAPINRGGGSVALTDRILYIDFDYGYGICSDKNRDMTLSFVKTAQSGQTVGAAVQNRFDQIMVQSGAAATGLTAEAGGTIMMGERTRLNTVFLTGGTMQVLGAVTMTAGGLLSIDVSGYAADTGTVMIDNLAAIAGASLTLAAGATPAFGSYKLAGNAADFTGTVTARLLPFGKLRLERNRVQYAGRCGRKLLRSRPQCRRRTRADGVGGICALRPTGAPRPSFRCFPPERT